MLPAGTLLDDHQARLLDSWIPGYVVVRDHSWGLVGTTVLEVVHDERRLLVKAGDAADHHLAREIHAHEHWLGPWVEQGRAPVLLRADRDAKLLVRTWLPGRLVLGAPEADDPGTYRRAGALLAVLHGQASVVDAEYEARENARTLRWLDAPHRIDRATADRVRSLVGTWPDAPAMLVPTHGDWQPRNWLADDGEVHVIDLGRAAWRPAMTDLARLATQDFARDPRLEAAFLEGYGPDPRSPAAWARVRVREAVGTAAWAHQVGDRDFEAQGLRMLDEALSL